MARKKKFQITLDPVPDIPESKRHQGWCNSATCLANLYFLQERAYYDELVRIFKKDGKLDRTKVRMLFNKFMMDRKTSPIDDDAEGPIYLEEICKNLENELS